MCTCQRILSWILFELIPLIVVSNHILSLYSVSISNTVVSCGLHIICVNVGVIIAYYRIYDQCLVNKLNITIAMFDSFSWFSYWLLVQDCCVVAAQNIALSRSKAISDKIFGPLFHFVENSRFQAVNSGVRHVCYCRRTICNKTSPS